MRKSISLALVIVMMLSMFIFAIPASAATVDNGTRGQEHVEALYFGNSKPNIDGYVSEAEWGEATIFVDGTKAATKDESRPFSRVVYSRTGMGPLDEYRKMTYQLWFRWDENYLYVAVKVKDPDTHMLKASAGDLWRGDAFQMRVDWFGANSGTNGGMPWTEWEQTADFILGYTEVAGGFSDGWENNRTKEGITSYSNNPLGVAQVAVAPAGKQYSPDTANGYTTYEAALPWAYMISTDEDIPGNKLTYTENDESRNPAGGIGKELGISAIVYDSATDASNDYGAFLAWGSGCSGLQNEECAKVTTGSNAVVLSGDVCTPKAGFATYDARAITDISLSNKLDPAHTYYDYLGGDINREKVVKYEDLKTLTYDDPADTSFWGDEKAYKGSISDIGGEHGKVLDYRDHTLQATYIDSDNGVTPFKIKPTYTFQFDICYTGIETNPDESIAKYEKSMYFWFGGRDSVSYQCGYFFNDNSFRIVNNMGLVNTQTMKSVNYDLKKDNWYTWRFQFDNESCAVRLWVDDLSTDADNADNEWGTLIFNERNRYFYYTGLDKDGNTLLVWRFLNVQFMMDNVKVYNFASNKEIAINDDNGGSSNGGGTNRPITTEKTGGDKLTVDGAYKKDGKWFVPVKVKAEYKNAIQLSYTLKFDPTKAEFDSIKGLDEGTYEVTKVSDGEYLITIKDFAAAKAAAVGDTYFEIVLKVIDDSADISAIISDLSDSYRYTVTTGDATVYIVVAAVIAMMGCAAVVVYRKKRIEE